MNLPKEKSGKILVTPLPFSSSPDPNLNPKDAKEVVTTYLKDVLPKKERQELQGNINWHLVLDKPIQKKQTKKQLKKKKNYLTRKERQKLNLLKLPKKDWESYDFIPLNALWNEYIQKVIWPHKQPVFLSSATDVSWDSISSSFLKAEFTGACIKVVRSSVPSYVDLIGFVVLETKSTFQIVTPEKKLKIILKAPCVFEIKILHKKIQFMGKSLIGKPSNRSLKVNKLNIVPDL